MEAAELIVTLNAYPMWVEFDDATSNKVFDEIHRLSCLYRCGSLNERRSIAAKLEQAAKFQMFEYSRYKATEATRTPLAINILEGLVPVVMGGGSSRSATAGFLMAILLRSAQLAALDGKRIFADAADLAGTEDQASDFRNFPSMPLEPSAARSVGGLRQRRL